MNTTNTQMQVLELHELEAVEAGMAAALWGDIGQGQDEPGWSTLSLQCQAQPYRHDTAMFFGITAPL
ncbi:hypothetical protein GCM10027277_45530 [Pseudoduganella ginsengisoli]